MDSDLITAVSTVLLSIVGFTQLKILITQNRQSQFNLIEEYRKRWFNSRRDWGAVIFIGRSEENYYQVVNEKTINQFILLKEKSSQSTPSIWALDSSRVIFITISDICIKVLKKQLDISDVYPIFGTELLRNSKPLRALLDKSYSNRDYQYDSEKHHNIRNEIQDWLVYHDGIRRRCLILIDLLWAEATCLDDLPPADIKSAADAKVESGKYNRDRVYTECMKLNSFNKLLIALKLSKFLKHSEYKEPCSKIGVDKKRLVQSEKEWTDRLLT